jgi:hypothetical protein
MAVNTLILINRDRMQFATGGRIFEFPLLPTLIKDLEIVDRNLLLSQIEPFIQKNQITFGSSVVLLSEAVCFVDEAGGSLQDFASALPFENPSVISLGGKSIGTNKDLYEFIVELVAKYGGEVKAVAPIFLAKETFGVKSLEEGTVRFILGNEEVFTKGYFSFNIPPPMLSAAIPKQKVTPLSIRLGIVFAVLVIAMIVLLVFRK